MIAEPMTRDPSDPMRWPITSWDPSKPQWKNEDWQDLVLALRREGKTLREISLILATDRWRVQRAGKLAEERERGKE